MTDREVLSLAASEVRVTDLTDAEKDALDIFNRRLEKFSNLQAKREEYGSLWHEQQFGENGDRDAARATLNRMHVLDAQIERAGNALLDVEDKDILKKILQKARRVVEQYERGKGDEKLRRWRDRRENASEIKKHRERLRSDVDDMIGWVLHPDNKNAVKHIPDALKDTSAWLFSIACRISLQILWQSPVIQRSTRRPMTEALWSGQTG